MTPQTKELMIEMLKSQLLIKTAELTEWLRLNNGGTMLESFICEAAITEIKRQLKELQK